MISELVQGDAIHMDFDEPFLDWFLHSSVKQNLSLKVHFSQRKIF